MAVHPDALAFFYDKNDAPEARLEGGGGIAVLTIDGPLEQIGGYWYQGYDQITKAATEAFGKPEVWALVLRLRSPGGDVAGMLTCAETLKELSKASKKPLIAAVDEDACSAAYAIASAAEWIVVPTTGVVGSIGVLACIGDRVGANEKDGLNIKVIGSGKYKGELHPDNPLTDESIQRVQDEVDDLAKHFAALVAQNRQTTPAKVLALQADTFRGQKAVDVGLADQVGTYADALEVARQRAAAARPAPTKTTAARPPTRTAMNDYLIRLLGLASTATPEEIEAALKAKGHTLSKITGAETLDGVIGAFGSMASATAKVEALQGQLTAANAKAAELQAKVEAAEADKRKAQAQTEIDQMTAAGTLPPAMKAFALSIHGTAAWTPFVEGLNGTRATATPSANAAAPAAQVSTVVAPSAGGVPGSATPSASAPGRAFDAKELATLKALGLTEEQARKALADSRREARFDFTSEEN